MNPLKQWMAEISEIDEFFGRKPRYPQTLYQYHLQKALNKSSKSIINSNAEIVENIKESTSIISGTLQDGFEMMARVNVIGFNAINNNLKDLQNSVVDGFNNVVNELNKINSILNWGFSKIIELNKQRNILLDDIVGLLNIPDIEKERKLNIEKGINFLKKSVIDLSFIDDAKKYFERALNKEPNDFYVLYNLGIIHLFYKKHLDINKAKKYFLKSGKYANADIFFNKVDYSSHSSTFKNNINPKSIATYSYLYAARCYYLLNECNKALETALKAEMIDKENDMLIYDIAKYQACNNNIDLSIKYLDRAIKKDRFVSLKIVDDEELMKYSKTVEFLNQLRMKKLYEGLSLLKECKKNIRSNSFYHTEIIQTEKYLNKKTFLDSLYAIDNFKILLDKIKKENSLKDFVLNEIAFIEKNKISNSNFEEIINKIKNLYVLNTVKALKEANKKLTVKMEFSYLKNNSITKKLVLKKHILFEKKCLPLIRRHESLKDEIKSLKSEQLLKRKENNEDKDDIIAGLIIFVQIFIFGLVGHLLYKIFDNFIVRLKFFVIFIIIYVISIYVYKFLKGRMSYKEFEKKWSYEKKLKKEINELELEINESEC